MAKQHGPIKLTGQIGGISFYEMNGEYYARLKTHHNVSTDPRFTKTYLNALDFGTANRASKLLRDALGRSIISFSDTRMASRMTGRFVHIVHADSTHACGRRKVLTANLALLKGFEFNKRQALEATGLSIPGVSIDRAAGLVKISLAVAPNIAAGARLVAGIVCINFDRGTYTRHNHTASLPTDQRRNGELIFCAPCPTDSHSAIIVTLGYSASGEDRSGAMAIVAVQQPSASVRVDNRIKRSFRVSCICRGLHRPPKLASSVGGWSVDCGPSRHPRQKRLQTFSRAGKNADIHFRFVRLWQVSYHSRVDDD